MAPDERLQGATDRLLICQAIHHTMTLVTVDAQIQAYPVETLAA